MALRGKKVSSIITDIVVMVKRRYMNLMVLGYWSRKQMIKKMCKEFGFRKAVIQNVVLRPGYMSDLWKDKKVSAKVSSTPKKARKK